MIDRKLFELQCTEVPKKSFREKCIKYIPCGPARKGRDPLKDDRNTRTNGNFSLKLWEHILR